MSYTLTLTHEERKALWWISARYESARILADGLLPHFDCEDDKSCETHDHTFTVPEHVAWEYRDALKDDNGDDSAILPPCAGGTLAGKLLALYDSIV